MYCGKCSQTVSQRIPHKWGQGWGCDCPNHAGQNFKFTPDDALFGCDTYNKGCNWAVCKACWDSNTRVLDSVASSIADYSKHFDAFDKEVTGGDLSDDDDDKFEFNPDKVERDSDNENEAKEKNPPYMFFDFRNGSAKWPGNVELIGRERGDLLVQKAIEDAERVIKSKSKKSSDTDDTTVSVNTGVVSSITSSSNDWKVATSAVEASLDAKFDVLNDGSTALVLRPGQRLKINLKDLLLGGDESKEERAKAAKKNIGGKGMFRSRFAGFGMKGEGAVGGTFGARGKTKKIYVNEYTITMDVKLEEAPPPDGMSIFQTGLVQTAEEKRTGQMTVSQSDGECLINSVGGIGIMGTFGDTSKVHADV